MDSSSGERFRDPLVRLCCFADSVLVTCPDCGQCAAALSQLGGPGRRSHLAIAVARRLLRCPACGLAKDQSLPGAVSSSPVDPWFRLPLWLQAGCCGKLLWAYNTGHLDLLEAYIGARLRERGPVPGSMSMAERLPAWLKSAKNRQQILRTCQQLRTTVPASLRLHHHRYLPDDRQPKVINRLREPPLSADIGRMSLTEWWCRSGCSVARWLSAHERMAWIGFEPRWARY